MPIVLNKVYSFKGNYTERQKEAYIHCIELFRIKIGDIWVDKNILNKGKPHYKDEDIVRFIDCAVTDLNGGYPRTNLSVDHLVFDEDDDLVVNGAIIFSFMAEGLLNLRNNANYSDGGININLFDKTQYYQSWIGMQLNSYVQDKALYKSSIIPKSPNSGFVGVSSEFAYYDLYGGYRGY